MDMLDRDKICWPLFDSGNKQNVVAKITGLHRSSVQRSHRQWLKASANYEISTQKDKTSKCECIKTNHGISNHCLCAENAPHGNNEKKPFAKPFFTAINKPYKVVALFDAHTPWTDVEMFHPATRCVFDYVSKTGCDEFITGGDLFDFNSISYFNKNRLLLREGQRIKREYHVGNIYFDIISEYTKKHTFLKGNHEERVYRLIEQEPQFEGELEIEYKCRLNERGINYVDLNKVYSIGEANFIHGYRYNMNHAATYLNEYHCNLYYGHVHDVQCHAGAKLGSVFEAMSLGCGCDINPHYRRNKPTRYVNAFGVFYFNSDGSYTRYVPIIIDGKCCIEGVIYNGNK